MVRQPSGSVEDVQGELDRDLDVGTMPPCDRHGSRVGLVIVEVQRPSESVEKRCELVVIDHRLARLQGFEMGCLIVRDIVDYVAEAMELDKLNFKETQNRILYSGNKS